MIYIIILVDCGSLNNPDNGQVNFMETFGGSIANYSCNQQFVLCGAESRTCQSNGSWSESPPDCISRLNACIYYLMRAWCVCVCDCMYMYVYSYKTCNHRFSSQLVEINTH